MSLRDGEPVTAEDMLEVIETGQCPVAIVTDAGLCLYGVVPSPSSKLQSEDEALRHRDTLVAIYEAGQHEERSRGAW